MKPRSIADFSGRNDAPGSDAKTMRNRQAAGASAERRMDDARLADDDLRADHAGSSRKKKAEPRLRLFDCYNSTSYCIKAR